MVLPVSNLLCMLGISRETIVMQNTASDYSIKRLFIWNGTKFIWKETWKAFCLRRRGRRGKKLQTWNTGKHSEISVEREVADVTGQKMSIFIQSWYGTDNNIWCCLSVPVEEMVCQGNVMLSLVEYSTADVYTFLAKMNFLKLGSWY